MATRIIQVGAEDDLTGRRSPLTAALRAVRAGRLVGFPTETVYGVAAAATEAAAVSRLRDLKDRPGGAFTVHLGSPADAGRYVADVPPRARALMRKAWPGPLTLLLPVPRRLPDGSLRGRGLRRRIGPEGVVGLRCPDDPVARALLSRTHKPVLATSANLPGRAPATSAAEALEQLDGRIDVLIDGGPTRHRRASSIVAVDAGGLEVVREGVYGRSAIERLSRLTILFVCTGNTCRSPMAAWLAEKLLSDRLGCRADELPAAGVQVRSAGTFALAGGRASPQAVDAARALGAEPRRHRSRKLTKELINEADLIFCMGRSHVAEVTGRVSGAAGRTFLLDARGDIADPIGGDADRYAAVARRIRERLRKRLSENGL